MRATRVDPLIAMRASVNAHGTGLNAASVVGAAQMLPPAFTPDDRSAPALHG